MCISWYLSKWRHVRNHSFHVQGISQDPEIKRKGNKLVQKECAWNYVNINGIIEHDSLSMLAIMVCFKYDQYDFYHCLFFIEILRQAVVRENKSVLLVHSKDCSKNMF